MNGGRLPTPLPPPHSTPTEHQGTDPQDGHRKLRQACAEVLRGPGESRVTVNEFQRRAEQEPGFHGLMEQSDDTRGSPHSNHQGTVKVQALAGDTWAGV